jgi:ABC-type branched-subunit amino acid transport system ATPase component
MNSPVSPLLHVAKVSHHFGGLQVLHDVEFSVNPGALCGLIGPNGAGKSTLFNIVSGFLSPQHGAVHYAGHNLSRRSVQERCRAGLLRTFQTPKVFGSLTVRENLMAGFHRHTSSTMMGDLLRSRSSHGEVQRMRVAAEECGGKFGLTDVMDTLAGRVPAGIQRIVELARAYVCKPRLLMLDEPSSGLNQAEIEQLRTTLRELNREGITLLLVSHDMNLMSIASCIHVLCFGAIIATGTMTDLQSNARVREAYLGVPA